MAFIRRALVAAALVGLSACGRNPRFCDPDNGIACGNESWVCDVNGVCAASDHLTNSCIAPDQVCWDAGTPVGHGVAGMAIGVRSNVNIELGWSGGTEMREVSADGGFQFEHRFSLGDSYTLSLVGSPACALSPEFGIIDGDVSDAALTCEGVTELSDLRLSVAAPLAPTFSPTALSYDVAPSLLAQATTVTATAAYPGATIALDSADLSSGIPSSPLALAMGSTNVEIVVSYPPDFERTYQVSIDRGGIELAQLAYAKASNTDPGDDFGYSVATDGDTVVVGAPNEASGGLESDNGLGEAGAVYVFRRSGSTWSQEAYLKPIVPGSGDHFGWSVAIDGDLLVVGAPGEDAATTGINGDAMNEDADRAGAAYLFRRTGSAWAQEAYFKPAVVTADMDFGHAVAIAGETCVVGAPRANGAGNNAGAAYAFALSYSVWVQQQALFAGDPNASDQFGWSVALDGDVAVVGTPYERSNATGVNQGDRYDTSLVGAGAAYVFRRSGTTWSQEAYMKASNTRALGTFGWGVAISGDVIAVGAPAENSAAVGVGGNQADTSAAGAGAVYVFRYSDAWTQEAYVKASNTTSYDNFGWSLGVRGGVLVVGAYSEDSNSVGVNNSEANDVADDAGATYVFRRGTTTWSQQAYVKASNTGAGDHFGETVGISDDTMVIGARYEDGGTSGINGTGSSNTKMDSGAIYVFH